MRQLFNLVWIISLLQEVSCTPDLIEQQKSIFQQSKNIISYLPIKSGSRWESLNSAISFGSIFGQQNSTALLPDSSLQSSMQNSTPSNDEAVLTSESEQSYQNCMKRCQALASTSNETLDEFSCGCDQILKPNKIPYKYRDQFITVKQNPFHTVKPACQNCSKNEKQPKEDAPAHTTPTTASNGSIRIKNNGTNKIYKSQPKPHNTAKYIPSEQQNSTSSQKQIIIKNNSKFKINKKQNQDLVKNPRTSVNKTKNQYKSHQKQIKNISNEQVKVKNSDIVKNQQNIFKPIKQNKNIEQQNTNLTKEGIRIKSEQKNVAKESETKEQKHEIKSSQKQKQNTVSSDKKKSEQLKQDRSIRIKNNGSANIPSDTAIPFQAVNKKANQKKLNKSKKQQLKKDNQKKIQKGIPIKENVKYSYVNKTKPILKKRKSVQIKTKQKKIFKSKNFGRKNESIPIKNNQTKIAKNKSKKMKNQKIKVKMQKKIPIKSKIEKKVIPIINSTEPEIDTRIRIKREDIQQVIPQPQEQKIEPVINIKEVKNSEKQVESEVKVTEKQVKGITQNYKIEKLQTQDSYEIRIKNNGTNRYTPEILKKKAIINENIKPKNIESIEKKSENEIKVKDSQKIQKVIKKTESSEVVNKISSSIKVIKNEKKQDASSEPEQKHKTDIIPSDNSIRVKNNGSKKISQSSFKNISIINKKQSTVKVYKASLNKSQQIFKKITKKQNISQPLQIKNKQKEIVEDENSLYKKTKIQENEYKSEPKQNQELERYQIRVKNNGSKILKSLKLKKTLKSKNTTKINITKDQSQIPAKIKNEEIHSVKEIKEVKQKDQSQPEQIECKSQDLPKEDHSIRVKNNGSRKTHKKNLKNKVKKNKSLKAKKVNSNISKVKKQPIINDEISIKVIVKKPLNKTVKAKSVNFKEPQTNISNKQIRVKTNGSKQSLTNSSIQKSKLEKNIVTVKVNNKKQNASIESKQSSILKVVDDSSKVRVRENDKNVKIIKEDDQSQQKKPDVVIQENHSIRVKNNGSVNTVLKKQKNKTKIQIKKKQSSVTVKKVVKQNISKKNISKKNISKKNIQKKNVSKKNISKQNITKKNITVYKVKVNAPPLLKIAKKEEVIEKQIKNEKSEENPEEKKKELERERQYKKETFEQPQKLEVKISKIDDQSIRIKNNGTIILRKVEQIIQPKSVNKSKECNQTKNEPVPIIKDTHKQRKKINYSKAIEAYKKSLKTYKPFPKSKEPLSNININVTKESIRVKNSDPAASLLNTTKIVKIFNSSAPVKKSKKFNLTKKVKISSSNVSIIKKEKKSKVTKNQIKQINNITKTKKNKKTLKKIIQKNKTLKINTLKNKTKKNKIQKKAEQKTKAIMKSKVTKQKKAVKKVKPPKIVVKSYPITNIPVHSRDIQKGASIPMKKRNSQNQKIVKSIKNISKIALKNVTSAKKSQKKQKTIKGNATIKKSKKRLIPVMTKKVKVINQSKIKIVKKMKIDSSIEEKPLKSIVDEIITKPLKKPKKKSIIKNKTKSVKKIKVKTLKNKTKSIINKKKPFLKNKTQSLKHKNKIQKKNKTKSGLNKTKLNKNKKANINITKKVKKANITKQKSKIITKNISIPKPQQVKAVLKKNQTIKVKQSNVSKQKQTANKSNKKKTVPVKNVSTKKQILNITKNLPKIVKQSLPKSLNKSIINKPTITHKGKNQIDEDDIDEPIKDDESEKDDEKEECKQPVNKKPLDEINRDIRVKNSDAIQNSKSDSNYNYKASVNYQTKNRTTTINFSDSDGSATISITNINGTQLLNVTGEKIACQSQFCKQFSSISQIFSNQRNMTMMTPIVSDVGSLSQGTSNSTLSKSEKESQAQFINKKLNENSDYNEVLGNQEKLKHLSFRIQKLTLLGNLMKKFFNKNDFKKEWFFKPVIFHFLEFKFVKDKPKISIIKSIRARNLQGVIKSFKITVKDKFLKSNNTHFGIVGNSKLLFSTSSFKNFLVPKNSDLLKKMNYTSTQNEFVNDNISKIFIGYGFFKQIIKLPANFRTQQYPILLSVDKNSFAQDIQLQSQLNLNQNISLPQNKNRFLFDGKGNLVKSSETNFKGFITLVNSFQKKGLFKGVILDQNQLGVKIRQGQPPKGFQRQFAYTFSPRTMRQVKEGQSIAKKTENVKENECKKYLEGSKRYQVCILNDQYRGPKQVISLSRKYNFGAIVYDPERKKISKAADILSSNMRRGLKTIQWNLIQKYVKNRKEYQFMTFSENGPLVCSKNRSDNLCKLMTGYSLTQGWWKNPKFIDSSKLDQFYVIVKNLKTNIIEFINTGCDQEYAVNLMKKMTSTEKNSIGAVLNSDSQLVDMTLTNPSNEKEMQYKQIYEIIGEYLSNNLHLFDKNLRNEYEASIL